MGFFKQALYADKKIRLASAFISIAFFVLMLVILISGSKENEKIEKKEHLNFNKLIKDGERMLSVKINNTY